MQIEIAREKSMVHALGSLRANRLPLSDIFPRALCLQSKVLQLNEP